MDQNANTTHSWHDINRYKYFGCRTRLGAHLPIIIKLLDKSTNERPPNGCSTIRITSIPMIAGLVTIRQDGIIEGCNDVFVKYMFGYSQEELVTGQKSIGDLMPQFPGVLQSLRRDDLLQHGVIINNIICRKLVADLTTTPPPTALQGGKRLTQTPNGQPLPVLIAVHRDGTEFEIQLQLKLAEESDDGICALWITFDRDSTLSRVGHKMGGPALELKQHNGLGLPTAKRDERIIEEEDDDDDDDRPVSSLASSVRDNDCQNDQGSINTNRTLEYTKETQPRQYQPQHPTEKTEPMIIPLKTAAGYTSSPTTPSTHDSPGMSGSLSVSRPPCDTGSPRVTSFSRPTFSTYTQRHQEDQPSPTSPSSPYSPTVFSGNRPRAFSTASVTMPEYSAQTHSLCIDDFEILDEIGQGAYGLVKLAVQKKDVSQVKKKKRAGKSTCMQKKEEKAV